MSINAEAALSEVRRLEAVSFRSWPASNTSYDGTWAIRLTAGHPSKRLNSINPLDRADNADLENRIARMGRRFQSFGRPLVFRLSPLAPPELSTLLQVRGWKAFDETRVMTVSLADARLDEAMTQVPLQDVGRWIDQSARMGSFGQDLKPGLHELIGKVEGEIGLFLTEDDAGTPIAAVMAVRYGNMVGLFEAVSNPALRRHGFGRRIIRNAMLWGRNQGAEHAWLQCVSDNAPALALYEKEGFSEVYRYDYRQAPASFRP